MEINKQTSADDFARTLQPVFIEQEGQNGPGSLTWFFEIALAIFFLSFSEKNSQEFLYVCTVQESPFNNMFIDRSKFQEQFWKGSLKEHFYEIISKSDQ